MSSAKWLYRAVVIVCRCPSSLPTIVNPTPEPAPIEAKLCRRSCNRTPPSCACLVMARQGRCKSWRGVSLLTPGKAASPSRGSAVNTASAGAPSKTWRRPVLASTNSRRPFGISTSRHRRCKTSRSRRPVKSSNRIAAVTIGLITVQRFFSERALRFCHPHRRTTVTPPSQRGEEYPRGVPFPRPTGTAPGRSREMELRRLSG